MSFQEQNVLARAREVSTPAFAHLIPDRAPTMLNMLISSALATKDAAATHQARVDCENWSEADEVAQDQLDNIAFFARRVLLDYLLCEHHIGTSMASRIGEVL